MRHMFDSEERSRVVEARRPATGLASGDPSIILHLASIILGALKAPGTSWVQRSRPSTLVPVANPSANYRTHRAPLPAAGGASMDALRFVVGWITSDKWSWLGW